MDLNPVLGFSFLLVICGGGAFWIFKIIESGQRFQLEKKRLQMEQAGGGRTEELLARCAALEKRCSALEEQMHATQMQLADEQRTLDRKLTAILPGSTAIPDAPADKPQRTTPSASSALKT